MTSIIHNPGDPMMLRALCLALTLAPVWAQAADLSLPAGARELSNRVSLMDSYDLPIAAFADGAVPVRQFEGHVDRQTWRLFGSAITTLQLLAPLRAQLADAGYEVVFECNDVACGGFDFRFNTEITPAPDMFVDVRNYRFLSAVKNDTDAIGLLISVNRDAAYLQIIQVTPVDTVPGVLTAVASNIPAEQVETVALSEPGMIGSLEQNGHVVLSDLEFETGAQRLGKGPFASLTVLAGYLTDNPELKIAVVGHTDSVGTLDSNIVLSKQRARAVRDRLIADFGIAANRIEAEGMGYLAPIASNLTAKGRDANRRVEVISLSQ